MKCVVGTLFYDNGKVLLDKPRKRPTYQIVGGSLEENETPLDGAFREAREELGNKVNLDKNLFKFLFNKLFIKQGNSTINPKIPSPVICSDNEAFSFGISPLEFKRISKCRKLNKFRTIVSYSHDKR